MYISKLKRKAIIDLYSSGYSPSQLALVFNDSSSAVIRVINQYLKKESVKIDNPSFNSLVQSVDFDSFFNHLARILNQPNHIQLLDTVLVIFSLIKEHNLSIDDLTHITDKLKIFMGTNLSLIDNNIEDLNTDELKAYIEEVIRHYK